MDDYTKYSWIELIVLCTIFYLMLFPIGFSVCWFWVENINCATCLYRSFGATTFVVGLTFIIGVVGYFLSPNWAWQKAEWDEEQRRK